MLQEKKVSEAQLSVELGDEEEGEPRDPLEGHMAPKADGRRRPLLS